MEAEPKLIYLVDDSRSVRNFFSTTLLAEGFVVEAFDNPIPCIDAIASMTPHCLITDFEMPGMNGIEFCAYLKSREDLNKIPIIFLSNHEDDSKIIAALDAGADDYLPKGTNPEIILGKIKLMIEIKAHREKCITHERLRTYRATISRVEHELSNVMTTILPLLEKSAISPEFSPSDPFAKSSQKLNSYLWKLAETIHTLTCQPENEIQFETYVSSTEMVTIRK